jgi:chemotaxis protein methyltransferase CheR
MRRRVLAALGRSGLSKVSDLERRTLEDPELFAGVLEDLTVRVSSMFRDPGFFRTFRARVTPLLRTYPRINVWISGCASGEEAYSMAIVLAEQGLYDRCQIFATDLSARALAQAKRGVYPAAAHASAADGYARAGGTSSFATHTTTAYDGFTIRESLRRNIFFFRHDLVNDFVFAEMQIVLCRNVMIYFGRDLQSLVLEKLAQSLCPGGSLCLGMSERLAKSGRATFLDFAPEDRIYRRAVAS